MMRIEKPIDIISDDFNANEELPSEYQGVFVISVADSLTEDSVVDVKIGDTTLGWLTLEGAVALAKGIIEQITPLIKEGGK